MSDGNVAFEKDAGVLQIVLIAPPRIVDMRLVDELVIFNFIFYNFFTTHVCSLCRINVFIIINRCRSMTTR